MKSVNKETNNVLSLSPEAWTGREWLIEKVARLSAETLSLHHIDYLVRPDDCLQAQSIVSANCNHNQRSHKWGESIHSSCSFREFRKCRLMQINLYVNASYILKQVSLCVGVQHLLTHITAKKKKCKTLSEHVLLQFVGSPAFIRQIYSFTICFQRQLFAASAGSSEPQKARVLKYVCCVCKLKHLAKDCFP